MCGKTRCNTQRTFSLEYVSRNKWSNAAANAKQHHNYTRIGQLEVLPVQIRDHFYSKVKELQVEKPPKHSFYTEIRGISSRQKYVTARVVGTDNLIVR